MRLWLWIAGGALALFVLDRLALAAERRGWLYYRRRKASPGALGNALLEAHALIQPQQRNVLEQRREQPGETDAAGDPPAPAG